MNPMSKNFLKARMPIKIPFLSKSKIKKLKIVEVSNKSQVIVSFKALFIIT